MWLYYTHQIYAKGVEYESGGITDELGCHHRVAICSLRKCPIILIETKRCRIRYFS